ncbi:hypothetical protein L3X38_016351 [Prunus dulcis]|uniref:Uncharacterized protein n=1 Tax=Prunus dulcis TaxID=3755 RepID=A0AAD4W7U2_PRUDU|nr:hypothetical protein L3X38_016351 [Prunus dulcis]
MRKRVKAHHSSSNQTDTVFSTSFAALPLLLRLRLVRVFEHEAFPQISTMEATKEQGAGLLHHILPPRLEDAGLEDCALPADSIKEAFLKAATAVKSRSTSIFTADEDEEAFEDCISDPWPDLQVPADEVIGAGPETRSTAPCGGDKGRSVEVGGDEVVVGGEEVKGDKMIVGGEDVREGADRACVDGLAGLEIGGKKNSKVRNGDGEGPILVGGYV